MATDEDENVAKEKEKDRREYLVDLKGHQVSNFELCSIKDKEAYVDMIEKVAEGLKPFVQKCPKCGMSLCPIVVKPRNDSYWFGEVQSLQVVFVPGMIESVGFVPVMKVHPCFPDPMKMQPQSKVKKRKAKFSMRRKPDDSYGKN